MKDFNPKGEYGRSVAIEGQLEVADDEERDKIKKKLWDDMVKVIPKDYRYRVRFFGRQENIFPGKPTWMAGWLYSESFKPKPTKDSRTRLL